MSVGENKARSEETICEDCLYYDEPDEWGERLCILHLDEDEMGDLLETSAKRCPYYRSYDEYKSVRMQN